MDAVQVLTGCSIGKGNLIYRDYGKQVYTFACRNSGQAVRISVKGKVWQSPEYSELRKKVFGGEANDEEKEILTGTSRTVPVHLEMRRRVLPGAARPD